MRHATFLARAFALSSVLLAQSVPTVINYQGRLTDNTPAQAPITATVNMQFQIWDDPTAGTLLWSEPAAGGTPVIVTGGVFSVQLGNLVPVPIPASVFSGTSRYLQIIAAGEVLTPRQRISSTGFAHQAQNAASANSATTALTANSATTATTATTATSANDAAALGGIAAANWQQRIATPCAAGTAINAVAVNGTPTCVTAGTSGQDATTVFGSAALTVTPTTAATVIPGLTTTLTVPAGSRVLISTDGGIATTSAVATGFSVVDVFIAVDGVALPNGAYARVIAANTSGITSGVMQFWSLTTTVTLTAGSHTISVRTVGVNIAGAANATVSGNNTSPLQGELSVVFIKL
jgi:hypothetical protein